MPLLPVLVTLATGLFPGEPQPAKDAVLDNGILVSAVHAEGAGLQVTFTYLPLGLLDDEGGRTQYAHLLEHLMIRSTDPHVAGLEVDGIRLSGETTALGLRMETLAPVEKWRDAQERHARWLMAREVDANLLAREKQRIAEELAQTSERGYTHKWAMAAWNQVVRHGASHVDVAGDVIRAGADDAEAYMARRLRPGPAIRVVSVGPIPPEEVIAAIEEDFGALPRTAWRTSSPSREQADIREPTEYVATWDLSGRHYLEWYALPESGASGRVAAHALAQVVNARLQALLMDRRFGARAVASVDLVTPEGRWLLISISIPDGVELDEVRGAVWEALRELSPQPQEIGMVQRLAGQLTEWPNFKALRHNYSDTPGAEFVEASVMLAQLNLQWLLGMTREQLSKTYAALEVRNLETLAESVLDSERRSSLLLEPAD